MPRVFDGDYTFLTKLLFFFYKMCFFLVTINNNYNTLAII